MLNYSLIGARLLLDCSYILAIFDYIADRLVLYCDWIVSGYVVTRLQQDHGLCLYGQDRQGQAKLQLDCGQIETTKLLLNT